MKSMLNQTSSDATPSTAVVLVPNLRLGSSMRIRVASTSAFLNQGTCSGPPTETLHPADAQQAFAALSYNHPGDHDDDPFAVD